MRIQKISAFTIIEIVIAMTVLFIGVLGVFALFPAAYKMADLSKTTTRMTLVGQSKLEELVALGFDNLVPGTYPNIDLSHLIADPAVLARFQNTQVVITTAQGNGAGNLAVNPLNNNPLLLRLDVDVRYQLRPGRDKTEQFTTYLSRPAY